ncbi:MAG: BMP family ABC transporter substrate-binding protein [Spirochaetales bacterium]|nr:BMP family ABC transporter substrate-binding protein [Spirochaetales bacterium]
MKKYLTWSLIFCFILFTGTLVIAMPQGEKKQDNIMVSIATDIGGLGDKSFNDGCYAGLEKAKDELGMEIKVVESKQMTDYVPNLSGLAEDGSKLVFAVGFLMADAILESAQHYPESYFAGIDIWIDPASAPKNVLGINYKEHESGYLAGIVAGLLTKEYVTISPKLNNNNVLGMVLGMDIPPVERYQAGFYAGVMSVNPDCTVISIVTGVFDDQAKGKEATFVLAEQGADIVFQIAGLTGLGVINGAKEKGIFAIGVDVDQNYIAPETVITSAEKGVTESTFLVIKSVKEGSFKGGQNLVFGLNEDSTGISPYHGFDSVIPQKVKDKVNQAISDIKSGKIVVPSTRVEAGYNQ